MWLVHDNFWRFTGTTRPEPWDACPTFRTLIYVPGVYGLCHILVAWIQVLFTMSRRILFEFASKFNEITNRCTLSFIQQGFHPRPSLYERRPKVRISNQRFSGWTSICIWLRKSRWHGELHLAFSEFGSLEGNYAPCCFTFRSTTLTTSGLIVRLLWCVGGGFNRNASCSASQA